MQIESANRNPCIQGVADGLTQLPRTPQLNGRKLDDDENAEKENEKSQQDPSYPKENTPSW